MKDVQRAQFAVDLLTDSGGVSKSQAELVSLNQLLADFDNGRQIAGITSRGA